MALKGIQNPNYPFFTIIFLVSIIIIPCYNCFQQDTLNDYLEEEISGYDNSQPYAYPSYFSSIDDGWSKHFRNLRTDNVLNLKIFDKVGSTSTSVNKISVDDFGAKADGSDDTQAFEKAWKEACSSKGAILLVPKNKYSVKQVRFSGPCKSSITVQIYGTIEAWEDRSAYQKDDRHWLVFDEVEDLVVEGGGIIDGNGNIWWKNSCKVNKDLPCKDAPTALTFYKCKNLVVKNLTVQNAQQMHVSFQSSRDIKASNLLVTSPEDSPNTDGIHVTETQNIQITNSVIATGDDCISIVSGSKNVQAMDITCGPGHGISIGSLGSGNSKAYVSGVTIDGAKISGTANGVRIKTYQKSAIQVKNVVYKNIKGTSASNVAIKFDCSKNYPCQGILLEDVILKTEGGDEAAKASCSNVKLTEMGVVSPNCP
ncbi:hypothetical protein JCGZ_09664 [Jatropha curcas]|uniref:Uncharacterized protein n=1 Tax=Jatropha curcas TaxID=180498 RepID=A0A067LL12_JATCU|nr:hypothetical protein JCGZ_09664 [Jatropha curcas]